MDTLRFKMDGNEVLRLLRRLGLWRLLFSFNSSDVIVTGSESPGEAPEEAWEMDLLKLKMCGMKFLVRLLRRPGIVITAFPLAAVTSL